MFDRLLSFIKGISDGRPADRPIVADDPRVAAAALMFHIIDADGVRDKAEHRQLRRTLAGAYDLKGPELERIVADGEAAEREAVDLYAFTSILKRDLDDDARIEFIGLLWEMVYADGERHELEDNLVWRIAELIGVSSRDRVNMRLKVRNELGLDDENAD